MKKRLVLISVLAAVCAFGQDALPTPAGFHWEHVAEVKAAFLVPNGWHFKREKNANTLAYFATREDIEKTGHFDVGLTVNVMPHLESRDASAYAQEFIAGFPKGKTLLKSWDASTPPFVGKGCLVRDEHSTMHTLMVANPKTNTLYFFMFEAPNKEWEMAWKSGEQMVKLIMLDDEI